MKQWSSGEGPGSVINFPQEIFWMKEIKESIVKLQIN